jgi:predicted metalloprotease with PDZ domain
LPSLGHAHAWLDEEIATYVEPIVRARAGLVTAERYWRELAQGLPQGLPEAGDQGLDRTRTWGRTYWGGALFCFVADVRIREATHGDRSFDDVLRGLIATRDDGAATVDIARFLEAADRETGTNVVSEMYRALALAPGSVDLAALWSDLGVRVVGTAIRFDDQAPRASIRRAITTPPISR